MMVMLFGFCNIDNLFSMIEYKNSPSKPTINMNSLTLSLNFLFFNNGGIKLFCNVY